MFVRPPLYVAPFNTDQKRGRNSRKRGKFADWRFGAPGTHLVPSAACYRHEIRRHGIARIHFDGDKPPSHTLARTLRAHVRIPHFPVPLWICAPLDIPPVWLMREACGCRASCSIIKRA